MRSILPGQSDISDIEFTDYEMAEAVDELSTNAVLMAFLLYFLKKGRNALAPPLARIWCKSVSNGEIPDICKSATIIPIHKGKSQAVPKNYRHVALTSHLIKIFEKVVRKQIVEFMQANDLFNYSQHGFRGGTSCLSQLLCHFDRITSELENGKGVDVIYIDFAKAFDKVDHGITLRKLKLLGIKGRLGRWICSFLTNRVQSVLVEGKKSKPKPLTSGVPQGSVFGPTTFPGPHRWHRQNSCIIVSVIICGWHTSGWRNCFRRGYPQPTSWSGSNLSVVSR